MLGKEVKFLKDGDTIEDLSKGTDPKTPIGDVGLKLLQQCNLTYDQKRAAVWARIKGLIEQNPKLIEKESEGWNALLTKSPEERERIVPGYSDLRKKLEDFYNENRKRSEGNSKLECRGGGNFVKTLDLVADKTNNPVMVTLAYEIFKEICDLDNAGSLAYEIRRFIRFAPHYFIPEFLCLVRQSVETNGELTLDMDDFGPQRGSNLAAQKEIDKIRQRLEKQ